MDKEQIIRYLNYASNDVLDNEIETAKEFISFALAELEK